MHLAYRKWNLLVLFIIPLPPTSNMKTKKFLLVLLIALILCLTITEVDAKPSGDSRSNSRSSRNIGGSWSGDRSSTNLSSGARSSRSGNKTPTYPGTNRGRNSKGLIWGKTNFYHGLIVVPTTDGLYTNGYGSQCPSGCSVHERCGTNQECSVSAGWYVLDFITIVAGLGILLILHKKLCPNYKWRGR